MFVWNTKISNRFYTKHVLNLRCHITTLQPNYTSYTHTHSISKFDHIPQQRASYYYDRATDEKTQKTFQWNGLELECVGICDSIHFYYIFIFIYFFLLRLKPAMLNRYLMWNGLLQCILLTPYVFKTVFFR